MIISINGDNFMPSYFNNVDSYKQWCVNKIENGKNPDEIIVNILHEVNEAEEVSEFNRIEIHEFHCSLYSLRDNLRNNK